MQTIPSSRKTREWAIENIEAVDNSILYNDRYRSSRSRKIINEDLVNGKTHKEDMLRLLNPDNLIDQTLNTVPQHHPIINTKFNVLIGEALVRRFRPRAMVINPEAVSEKTEQLKAIINEKVQQIAANESLSDAEREKEIQKLMRYIKYDYSHLYEKMANNLLVWAMKRYNLKLEFKDGFRDILTHSEDIYQVYTVGGATRFRRLKPRRVASLFRGDSNRIEDSDLIILEDYMSPGQIQEEFYKNLKKSEVKKIEQMAQEGAGIYGDLDKKVLRSKDPHKFITDVQLDTAEVIGNYEFGEYVNENGDVRVLRVYWRSKTERLAVKSYDPITGEPIEFEAASDYIPDKTKGETAEKFYADEWWYGVKIGEDIYPIAEVYKDQFPDPMNPVRMYCGIFGTIYNYNNEEAVSLLDRCKPYIYLNDIVWDKLRDAFVSYLGPILQIDMAYKPTSWSFSQWMYYLKKMRLNVVNSFSEGLEGAAKGKLAGNFNTTGKTFNLDMGNYIQRLTDILQVIEYQLSIITGVTKAREGQTSPRETLGGIQASMSQSSISTEELYADQNATKLRVMNHLLHHMIANMGENPEMLQEVLDDGSLLLFEVDPQALKRAVFNVVIVDENDTSEMRQKIEALAHAGLQNDKVKFSTILDMIYNPSLIDIRHKIEMDELEKSTQDQENIKANQQILQEQNQAEKEFRERELQIKDLESERKMYTELERILADRAKNEDQVDLERDMTLEEIQRKRDEIIEKLKREDRALDLKAQEIEIKRKESARKPSTTAAKK